MLLTRPTVCYYYAAAAAASLFVLLLPSLTAASSSTSLSSSASSSSSYLPPCHFPADGELAKYHVDTACDRVTQNDPEYFERVKARNDEVHRRGMGVQHVPNEKTVTCPLPGSAATSLYSTTTAASSKDPIDTLGMHTRWLVENKSKVPVVIAYVDRDQNELEVSAMNSKISPPHADPEAILMPHQWKSIRTLEGHVFHVYELLGEQGNNYQLGRLVLQHRVGLIPIRNKYTATSESESSIWNRGTNEEERSVMEEEEDVPPVVDEESDEVDPAYQRDPPIRNERCNILYRGFRNFVGKPVHAYYIGLSQPPPLPTRSAAAAAASNGNGVGGGQMQCAEDFKFHLGVNEQAVNFENSWDSTTKFEASFVSHTYVFRLASHPNIMVDSYTMSPTHVVDCPTDDSTNSTTRVAKLEVPQTVTEPVVMPLGDDDPQEETTTVTTTTPTTTATTVSIDHAAKVIIMAPELALLTMMMALTKNVSTTTAAHDYGYYSSLMSSSSSSSSSSHNSTNYYHVVSNDVESSHINDNMYMPPPAAAAAAVEAVTTTTTSTVVVMSGAF